MRCKNCGFTVDAMYKVNQLGNVFCGDDCYEEFWVKSDDPPDDTVHPYIDDYECIRLEYIDYLENWESDLNAAPPEKLLLKIDDILDAMDTLFDEYFDYYLTEGDDGVFAHEIYSYLLKFDKLQKQIIQWHPEHKFLYYFTFVFSEEDMKWTTFSDLLKEKGFVHLQTSLNHHIFSQYPPSFEFKRKWDRDQVLQQLNKLFPNELTYIRSGRSILCDHCHWNRIYLTDDQSEYQDNWYFCRACEEKYYPGTFSKEDLVQEIQFHDIWRNLKKNSKKVYWPYYLRKIKRSCRLYNLDYPDWIELNYDF